MASDKARVLLVGCGGIGTIAALNLEAGGLARVTAVLRSNFGIVNRNGFTIHSCEHGDKEGWRPTEDAGPSLPDIIAPAVTPGQTVIVLIQNGVIEQKQPDLLHIGPFFNAYREWPEHEEAAKIFVRIYSAGGNTTCLYKEDVGLDRWSKLVYNASFNPICALTRVNASQLQTSSGSMDSLVIPAMKEVIKVAAAMGHDIPPIAITQAIRKYD
ncbi:hypothetical protein SGCOL_004237 [Colletotrichum sp. CLE4]